MSYFNFFICLIIHILDIYDNSPHWKFLEFWQFSKLSNFKNLLIFEIVKFGKLVYILNCKFVEFSKLEIHEIFPISKWTNFQNVTIRKINKFSEFFHLKTIQILKIDNLGKFCLFDTSHYSQFCLFSYLPFNIN